MSSLYSLLRKYSHSSIYLTLGIFTALCLMFSILFFPTVQIYRHELGPRGPYILTIRMEIGYIIPYAKYDSAIYFTRKEDGLSTGRFTEYISSADGFGNTKVVWWGLLVRFAILLIVVCVSLRWKGRKGDRVRR